MNKLKTLPETNWLFRDLLCWSDVSVIIENKQYVLTDVFFQKFVENLSLLENSINNFAYKKLKEYIDWVNNKGSFPVENLTALEIEDALEKLNEVACDIEFDFDMIINLLEDLRLKGDYKAVNREIVKLGHTSKRLIQLTGVANKLQEILDREEG